MIHGLPCARVKVNSIIVVMSWPGWFLKLDHLIVLLTVYNEFQKLTNIEYNQ